MNVFLKSIQLIRKSILIQLICIFIISFIFLYWIQFQTPNLLGADAYFHIKIAELVKTRGWDYVKSFPWANYSIWSKYPADLWFGHHLLLIPFTFIKNLIFGAKLSAVVFTSFVVLAFYFILRKFKIKYKSFWIFLLLVSSFHFLFRLNLSRGFVLSIVLLMLGMYLIAKKKYWLLLSLSIMYSWVYVASPLIIGITLIYIFCERLATRKTDFKLIIYPTVGIILGLLIRPDFPKNLYLIFNQVFYSIYYRWTGAPIRMGAEMFPISFQNLFLSSIPLLTFFFLSTAFLAIRWIKLARQARKTNNWKKINAEMFSQQKLIIITLTLLILSLLFLTLTLNSQRFVEYWAPFTLLYSAFATHLALRNKNINWSKIKRFLAIHKPLVPALVLFFCVAIIYSSFLNVLGVTSQMKKTKTYDAYKGAALWLEENTPQNSIVFHSDWDNFPMLFFWNHHNYYIIGMDPTFMYVYDQEKYWLWENITQKGIACDGPLQDLILTDKYSLKESKIIHDIIIQDFNSRYVFIDDHHEKFKKRLEKAPELFEKTYEDEYANVYKVK